MQMTSYILRICSEWHASKRDWAGTCEANAYSYLSREPRTVGRSDGWPLRLKEAAAPEDAVIEVAAQQLDAVAIIADNHRDNVVAIGFHRDIHQLAITTGGAGDLPLLAQVNGAFGRGELIRAARLDFDEAERLSVVSDQVNLGGELLPGERPPQRHAKIGRDDFVALMTFQIIERRRFAALAQPQMCGARRALV